jgi:hypothetical protein
MEASIALTGTNLQTFPQFAKSLASLSVWMKNRRCWTHDTGADVGYVALYLCCVFRVIDDGLNGGDGEEWVRT